MKLLGILFTFFERARAESAPWQLALAAVLGLFLGFVPPVTLQWVAAFAALLLVRANLIAFLLCYVVFFPLGVILEPLFHHMGNQLLVEAKSMHGVWAWMYHAPVLPYTRFNNTVVLGATLTALMLALPVYFLTAFSVQRHLGSFKVWFYDSLAHRAWLNSPLKKIYEYHFRQK